MRSVLRWTTPGLGGESPFASVRSAWSSMTVLQPRTQPLGVRPANPRRIRRRDGQRGNRDCAPRRVQAVVFTRPLQEDGSAGAAVAARALTPQ